MYNRLLISLQIEEKWYTFRLFFGILSCYYLHSLCPTGINKTVVKSDINLKGESTIIVGFYDL